MKNIIILLASFFFLFNCTKVEDGYQDKISYLPTEAIDVYLRGSSKGAISIDLFDINRNKVDQAEIDIFPQPEVDTSFWYKKGYQYKKTFSYSPSKLKSGIYRFENSSPFVIKNPEKKNDVLVIFPSNTDNAYNKDGGRSSYTKPKGDTLSFKRPFAVQGYAHEFLKWLPTQSFDVDYICDRDMDYYENIENYKVIIIPGHNEYWTRKARRNFDKFVNNGGHSLVLSANTMWWQVRYFEDKMVCHKIDSLDTTVPDSLKTVKWTNDLLDYQTINSIGADFNRGGYGEREDRGWDGYKIISSSPLFENTGIKIGDILSIPSKEYDGLPVIFKNEIPVLDTTIITFYKHRILGFDKAFRGKEGYGTLFLFQKTKQSGIIVNAGTTNWCSDGFTERDADKIKKLTYNFIDFLVNDKSVF